ncbi:MAG: hypothetical protein MHM6MM_005313 [Cercozoa sp. M6MM]
MLLAAAAVGALGGFVYRAEIKEMWHRRAMKKEEEPESKLKETQEKAETKLHELGDKAQDKVTDVTESVKGFFKRGDKEKKD